MYLYGGRNQGALVQLALNLRHRHPGVQIVGGYSPPHRPLSLDERDAVVRLGGPDAPASGKATRRALSVWRSGLPRTPEGSDPRPTQGADSPVLPKRS